MWIWVPNHHSYSNHKLSVFHHPPVTVPKCPQILRPYQSHKNLEGHRADAVQTQSRNTLRHHRCLQQRGRLRGKEAGLDWTLSAYIIYGILLNTDHSLKERGTALSNEKQSPFRTFHVVSVTLSIPHLAMFLATVWKLNTPLQGFQVNVVQPEKSKAPIGILSHVHLNYKAFPICPWVLGR